MDTFPATCPQCDQAGEYEEAWRGCDRPCPHCGAMVSLPVEEGSILRTEMPRTDAKRSFPASYYLGLVVLPFVAMVVSGGVGRFIDDVEYFDEFFITNFMNGPGALLFAFVIGLVHGWLHRGAADGSVRFLMIKAGFASCGICFFYIFLTIGLIPSRLARNEGKAIEACKAYSRAQADFREGNGRWGASLQVLHERGLIRRGLAEADASLQEPDSYFGYVFRILPRAGIDEVTLSSNPPALVASPSTYEKTGCSTFAIWDGRFVYQSDQGNDTPSRFWELTERDLRMSDLREWVVAE